MIIDKKNKIPILQSDFEYESTIIDHNFLDEINEARVLYQGTIPEIIIFYQQKKYFLQQNALKMKNILADSSGFIKCLGNNFFTTLSGDEIIINSNFLKTCLEIRNIMLTGAGYNIVSENEKTKKIIDEWLEKINFDNILLNIINNNAIDGTSIILFQKENENIFLELANILKTKICDNNKIIIEKFFPELIKGKDVLYYEFRENNYGVYYNFLIKKDDKWMHPSDDEKVYLYNYFNVKDYFNKNLQYFWLFKNNQHPKLKEYGYSMITPVISEILGKIESETLTQIAIRDSKGILVIPEGMQVVTTNGKKIDTSKQFKTIQRRNVDPNSAKLQQMLDAEKKLLLEYSNKVEFFQADYKFQLNKYKERKYELSIASSFNIPSHYLNIDSVGTTGEGILNEKDKLNKINRQKTANILNNIITNILNNYLKSINIKEQLKFEFNDIDEMTYNERLNIAEKIKDIYGLKEAIIYLYGNDQEKIDEILENNKSEINLDDFERE